MLKFLYIAPERLNASGFMNMLADNRPNLVVVDEVHTADMWGEDFRPSYHKISTLLDQLRPVKVLCLTATMTPENEKGIRRILKLEKAKKLVHYERRSNLKFRRLEGNDNQTIIEALERSSGPSIVYSSTVRRIEESLFPDLRSAFSDAGGIVMYHGKMEMDKRERAQALFMNGSAKYVVATNAFGLGVDKENVRMVLHTDLPGTIEAYAQEAGRAGRDGKEAICALAFDWKSVSVQKWFLENRNPPKALYKQVWRFLLSRTNDGDTPLNMSVSEIGASIPEVHPAKISTIMNVLSAAGLIERKNQRYQLSVDINGRNSPSKDDTTRPAELYRELVSMTTAMDSVLVMPPAKLAKDVSMSVKQLKQMLDRLHEKRWVKYTPASRSKRTILKGTDLDVIDWDRLKRKRELEFEQLDQMVDFATTPDHLKHKVLEYYFEHGKLPDPETLE
jgi:ATP-dependent DNA helicase RecQ